MASKFVRSIRQVKDVSKLAEYVTEPNDIVQDVEGNIYIRLEKGFTKISGGADPSDEIAELKKTVDTNTKSIADNKKLIDANAKSIADLDARVKKLETPSE